MGIVGHGREPHLKRPAITSEGPKGKRLELLDENRVMTVATMRSDGWPQATIVGYVHDDLTLYFSVARSSQKLANIVRDPRVSIALGHDTPNRLRGLSMAANAAEVDSQAEIDQLNALILDRYPEQIMFAPREVSAAIVRATPFIVSVIDLGKGPGEPKLVELPNATTVHRVMNTASRWSGQRSKQGRRKHGNSVLVRLTQWAGDLNRPGVPP
jgi:general stress protein 26